MTSLSSFFAFCVLFPWGLPEGHFWFEPWISYPRAGGTCQTEDWYRLEDQGSCDICLLLCIIQYLVCVVKYYLGSCNCWMVGSSSHFVMWSSFAPEHASLVMAQSSSKASAVLTASLNFVSKPNSWWCGLLQSHVWKTTQGYQIPSVLPSFHFQLQVLLTWTR